MEQSLYEQLINAALIVMHREKSNEKINELKNKLEKEKASLDYTGNQRFNNPHRYKAKLGWGWFLLIFFGISAIDVFMALMIAQQYSLLLAPIIFLAIVGIGLSLILNARKSKKEHIAYYKELFEKESKEYALSVKNATEEIEKINAEENKFQELYKTLISFLPEKYHTPHAVSFMLEAVKNLRTDSLTGAINLYEEELRWMKTQKTIEQQMKMQQINHLK